MSPDDRRAALRFEMAAVLSLGVFPLAVACGRVGYDVSSSGAGGRDASIRVVDSGLRDADSRGRNSGGANGSGGRDASVAGSGGAANGGAVNGGAPQADASGDGGGTGGAPVARDSGSPVDGAARPDGGSADAGPRCAFSPQDLADWCTELPSLPSRAVIDGELECGLATRVIVPQAYDAPGTPDATIEYAMAWAADGLYFYARVHDPVVLPAPGADPPWEGDSVELYVDSDGVYGAPPAYDAATRQLVIAAPSGGAKTARAQIYAVPPNGVTWTSTEFASYPEPDGYVVEAIVRASDLGLSTWALAAGDHVGFDVGLNVSASTPDGGKQGTRIGQYFLKVDTALTAGHPFQTVTAFCNPILGAR